MKRVVPELSDIRHDYAASIAASAGVTDAAVIDAFAAVPREHFLGAGPWLLRGGASGDTKTSDPAAIYQDTLVALDAQKGINNGQPSLHARAIAEAHVAPGERVVHVGAGTGYYTAILAHIVGPAGRVTAFEIEPTLAARAAENLREWTQVAVVPASALDAPLPEADVIYVSAALSGVPAVWLDALATGGRLILPLMPAGGFGHMWRIWRIDPERYAARAFSPAVFIGCVGGQAPHASDALRSALARTEPTEVRSLRRNVPADASAWLVGDGWWLSTSEP